MPASSKRWAWGSLRIETNASPSNDLALARVASHGPSGIAPALPLPGQLIPPISFTALMPKVSVHPQATPDIRLG